MIIHAKKRRPITIPTNLCTYDLKMEAEALNEIPILQYSMHRTPDHDFSWFKVMPNSKYWKPFGCPVYVSEGPLQT